MIETVSVAIEAECDVNTFVHLTNYVPVLTYNCALISDQFSQTLLVEPFIDVAKSYQV